MSENSRSKLPIVVPDVGDPGTIEVALQEQSISAARSNGARLETLSVPRQLPANESASGV